MKGNYFFTNILSRKLATKMHPGIAAFFKDYLSHEKVIRFGDQYVMNTHFPPYPGQPFDNMVEQFNRIGESKSLYSVTLAVTNRCEYNCWHCYNAGRGQNDIPFETLKRLVAELQALGAVHVTLSGGEPLLRDDLEDIVGLFDGRTYLTLNTTGSGLTEERARVMRERGLFALGVSLDSSDPVEHDRMRGRKGAFDTSLKALGIASRSGLYPYIISVATREFLDPEGFHGFMRFASQTNALEVHLIEPCAAGKLSGQPDALLGQSEKDLILRYQKQYAQQENAPVLSSFTYIESGRAFGCGAGLTHLYIDGTGEVSPCNLVPLSFGNIQDKPINEILKSMGRHFRRPRTSCAGRILSPHIKSGHMPLGPEESARLCEEYLPKVHPVPLFFEIRSSVCAEAGSAELQSAYNNIHEYYDDFWLTQAKRPIHDLIDRIDLSQCRDVFEAGSGTGYATVLVAGRLGDTGSVTAVDLSEGMLSRARRRAESESLRNIRFIKGNALDMMGDKKHFDLVLSSWVLGYIPLKPFFAAVHRALRENGQLAFVVHKEDSPYIPLRIFHELVARDPSILTKKVSFEFPRDIAHVERELSSAGFDAEQIWEGRIVFSYETPEEVLEHLLKSGAGTAFYEAIDSSKKEYLTWKFLKALKDEYRETDRYDVAHDYISCIAHKRQVK